MCQYFQDARTYAKQIINFLWSYLDYITAIHKIHFLSANLTNINKTL